MSTLGLCAKIATKGIEEEVGQKHKLNHTNYNIIINYAFGHWKIVRHTDSEKIWHIKGRKMCLPT